MVPVFAGPVLLVQLWPAIVGIDPDAAKPSCPAELRRMKLERLLEENRKELKSLPRVSCEVSRITCYRNGLAVEMAVINRSTLDLQLSPIFLPIGLSRIGLWDITGREWIIEDPAAANRIHFRRDTLDRTVLLTAGTQVRLTANLLGRYRLARKHAQGADEIQMNPGLLGYWLDTPAPMPNRDLSQLTRIHLLSVGLCEVSVKDQDLGEVPTLSAGQAQPIMRQAVPRR